MSEARILTSMIAMLERLIQTDVIFFVSNAVK